MDDTDSKEKRRGPRGLRAVGETVPQITRRLFGRRGFADSGLIDDWNDVAGRAIAEVCRPEKLSFPRRAQRLDGTLTLRVAPGHATVVQHLEPQLIERVNAYLGYRAVAAIRLQQGPIAAGVQSAGAAPRADVAVPSRAATTGDDPLDTALTRLEQAVQNQRREGA